MFKFSPFTSNPLLTFRSRARKFLALSMLLAPVALASCKPSAQSNAGPNSPGTPQSAETRPATREDIFLYRGIGASFLCNARAAGVEFPKAAGIAAATYAQVLTGKHGGYVDSAGKEKLTSKQLFSGAEFQIITGALQYCPKEVPEDIKTKVEEAIKTQQAPK